MESSAHFKDYRAYVSFQAGHYGKATLFENEYVLVGLNCLEPGQSMEKHAHEIQNRFYVVLEGQGQVWVEGRQQETQSGTVVWIPAGHAHRILNTGETGMVLLVGITPPKAD